MDGETPDGRLIADGNGSKEILAPEEGPRENLINTAIKFLQNPKVMSSPLYQKRAFLEKKGLTQDEITIAVQRSGVKEVVPGEHPNLQNQVASMQPGMIGQPPPGYYVPIPPKSGWARARDLTMTTVVVASVSYAVYQLFQKYLRPFMFGKSFEEKRYEQLQERIHTIEKSVADSMSEMNKTLGEILKSLNQQHSQFSSAGGELRGISEIRTDIASLKGLLLNKSQFPPAPSISPVLPAWQRAQAVSTTAAVPTVSATAAAPSYADVVKTSNTDHIGDTSTDVVKTSNTDHIGDTSTEQTESTDDQLSFSETTFSQKSNAQDIAEPNLSLPDLSDNKDTDLSLS